MQTPRASGQLFDCMQSSADPPPVMSRSLSPCAGPLVDQVADPRAKSAGDILA